MPFVYCMALIDLGFPFIFENVCFTSLRITLSIKKKPNVTTPLVDVKGYYMLTSHVIITNHCDSHSAFHLSFTQAAKTNLSCSFSRNLTGLKFPEQHHWGLHVSACWFSMK